MYKILRFKSSDSYASIFIFLANIYKIHIQSYH